MTRLARELRQWLCILPMLGAASSLFAADDTIHGAGATFPAPVYAQWAADYRRETGTDLQYEPVGSGEGVRRIERRSVDFGASDAPLPPAELRRIGLLQFPAVIGGVVPVVNIAGIRPGALQLSGQVLGDIYLGKIRKWNEPAIAELNPGLELPDAYITVVHRADASGTSFLWSEFLSRSNPQWKAKIGAAQLPAWPLGVDGTGNEGVASLVQRTRVSIGYVEFAYAMQHHLTYAAVRNRDGVFVQPGKASFSAAADAARWQDASDLDQLLIDQPGAASWPITGASFILVRTKQERNDRTRQVMQFFDWAFKHGKAVALALDYVPVPDSAVDLIDRAWLEETHGDATPRPAALSRP